MDKAKIKGAFKSKTIWFALALAVLTWVQTTMQASGLDSGDLAVVGYVISAVVVWLRSVTSVPLASKAS